jgi:adenylate cyclase
LFTEFRAHLAPQIAEALLAQGKEYGTPRRSRTVILFSDIRGFTKASANMEPMQVGQDLSRYLDHAVDVVHKFGGMVDKYIGDAVMAVWGGFLENDEAMADRAVLCARELIDGAAKFRIGSETVQVGVGIDGGNVFVGNIVSDHKKQFTVLGSAVSFASRLESETKAVGYPMVIGGSVYSELSGNAQRQFRQMERDIRGIGYQIIYAGPIGQGQEVKVDGLE